MADKKVGLNTRYSIKLGMGLGALLSFVYSIVLPAIIYIWFTLYAMICKCAFHVLSILSNPRGFPLVIVFLLSIGFLPAIIIGGVTGLIIDMLVTRNHKHLSAQKSLATGVLVSIIVSVAIAIPGFTFLAVPWTIEGILALDIPLIIYILAEGWLARKLYLRKRIDLQTK
jgi:hypothetical protein